MYNTMFKSCAMELMNNDEAKFESIINKYDNALAFSGLLSLQKKTMGDFIETHLVLTPHGEHGEVVTFKVLSKPK